MIKKIIILLLALNIVACTTTKPVVQTKKTIPTRKVIVKKEPVKTTPISKNEEIVNTSKTINKPVESEELEATSKVKVTSDIVYGYVTKFKNIAQDNMRIYKIPASVTLAQGILESGSGVGDLARKANNHFGIKCHKEWTGDSVRHDDDAAQECFRKYKDHSLFLTSRPWYNNLFKLEISDYKAWSYGLKKSGYATDPKYPAKLISIIERYQLYNYDNEVLGIKTDYVPPVYQAAVSEKMYKVEKGDTLYSISKRYNISIDNLKDKNKIQDNAISIGQNLIIE